VLVIMLVVVPVGRTGATPEIVVVVVDVEVGVDVDVEVGAQDERAQERLEGQHPPPNEAGQAWKSLEHVRVVCGSVLVLVVEEDVVTTITVVVWVVEERDFVIISETVTTSVEASIQPTPAHT